MSKLSLKESNLCAGNVIGDIAPFLYLSLSLSLLILTTTKNLSKLQSNVYQ